MKSYALFCYDDTGHVVVADYNYHSQKAAEKAASSLLKNHSRIARFHITKYDSRKPRSNPETVATATVAQVPTAAVQPNPYKRKTEDEWEIQGYYGRGTGWECLTTETSRAAAREQLKCYNENESYPHRIVKKRVRV